MNKKILLSVVILLSILSAAFFLVLFSSVRCEPDDMIISLELREGSFLKAFSDRYHFYSFRPTYTLGSWLTIGYSNNPANYPVSIFLFYISMYALFVFAVYKLLQELFSLKGLSLREKFLLISFSNILIICLYFLTTERIEIFAWVSASIIHLVPVVFVFLSAWLIIKQTKTSDYILLGIAAAIISGGAEHIAASVIVSIVAVLLVFFYTNRTNKQFYQEHKKQIVKALFFAGSLSLFLLICISNPGVRLHYNEVHQQTDGFATHHDMNVFEAIKLFCKPHKLIGLVFLLVFWMLFQNMFNLTSSFKIKLSYFLAVILCVVTVSAAASIYAYHTLSVGRIWFVLDVSVFVFLSVFVSKGIHKLKTKSILLYVGAIFFISTLGMFDIRHIPSLLNFSAEYDKIIADLQQKDNNEIIVLESFPQPNLINQVAVSNDPNNDVNQLFCKFYNIKAKISVKK